MKKQFYFLFILLMISILSSCRSPENKSVIAEEPDNTWLEEITITELQQGYKDGKYTVSEVVSAYLDRITEIDKNGPALNSIIVVNPDALQIAEGARQGIFRRENKRSYVRYSSCPEG